MEFTGDSIEAIEFDLRKFGGPKGSFPEPTQAEMEKFAEVTAKWQAGMVALNAEAKDKPPSKARAKKLNYMIFGAVAKLSGGSVSVEQLETVQTKAPRVMDAFLVYVMRELLDPTMRTPASTPSPAALNGVGART